LRPLSRSSFPGDVTSLWHTLTAAGARHAAVWTHDTCKDWRNFTEKLYEIAEEEAGRD